MSEPWNSIISVILGIAFIFALPIWLARATVRALKEWDEIREALDD